MTGQCLPELKVLVWPFLNIPRRSGRDISGQPPPARTQAARNPRAEPPDGPYRAVMSNSHPESRTQVAIDGGIFLLDRTQAYDEVRDRLQSAARSGGTFVDLYLEGDRMVSILVSSTSRVLMSAGAIGADGPALHFEPMNRPDKESRFSAADHEYYG